MIPPLNIIVIAILQLCPNPDKMGYIIQGEEVNCMEYYTNELISHPEKYKKELKNVKTR